MLIKKRGKPLPLQKLEALQRRLPPNHPSLPKIQQEIEQREAGYQGERKLDYYTSLLSKDFAILNDVTLKVSGNQVQMDSLILSNQAMFIIEVKNFYGTVIFDTNLRQCIRDNGKRLEGFDDPITQVENIELLFKKWLHDRQLSGIPIYTIIAFAHSSTILKVEGEGNINNVTYVTSV